MASYRIKLQILFLPFIVLPVVTAGFLYSRTLRSSLLDLEREIVSYHLESVHRAAEDEYRRLLVFGLDESPYYVEQAIANVESSAVGRTDQETFVRVFQGEEGREFAELLSSSPQDRRGLTHLIGTSIPGTKGPYLIQARSHDGLGLFIVSAAEEHAVFQPIASANEAIVLVSVLYFAIFLLVSLVAIKRLTEPLLGLSSLVRRMASGDLSVRAQIHSNDEVGLLAEDFNGMVARLEQSTTHMEQVVAQRTDDLSRSLEDLKSTQARLIESEKMASLGSLVAGISHEINTPLGISVTAITHMKELFDRAVGEQDDEEDDTIRSLRELLQIALNGLERSRVLVKNFKQVAVDQHTEEKRMLSMKEHLDSIVVTLHPELKHSHLDIRVSCPEELIVITYPGAIWQIVSNLVLNAAVHAFESGDEGRIDIRVEHEEGGILLQVEDNGKGMSDKEQEKIFEPFYTTRRGFGGTGLGLQIVYNLTTVLLKGKIECQSEPGKGTTFAIHLPFSPSL